MAKLIGTNPNQVPTNADLGSAAFMDVKDFLLSRGSKLSAIKKLLNVTSESVFIYDTSNDTDGGAWRKRTDKTSWYKEELNTVNRGKRREFPSVALLVLHGNGSGTDGEDVDLTIYDADDPNLSMWMIFRFRLGTGSNFTVKALNGHIAWCASDNGICEVNFIKDTMHVRNHVHYHTYYGGIEHSRVDRGTGQFTTIANYNIIGQVCYDLDMRVLPGAVTEVSTGLPRPAIAVITSAGSSLIRSEFDVENSSGWDGRKISFMNDDRILLNVYENYSPADRTFVVNCPEFDTVVRTYGRNDEPPSTYQIMGANGGLHAALVGTKDGFAGANYQDANNVNASIALYDYNDNSADHMYAFITHDANTGWLLPNTHGMWMSSNNENDAKAQPNILSGYGVAGDWTTQPSITLTSSFGVVSITGNGTGSNVYFFYQFAVEANTDYIINVKFGNYHANAFGVCSSPYNQGTVLSNANIGSSQNMFEFNSGSNTTLYLQGFQSSTSATEIQDVDLYKVVERNEGKYRRQYDLLVLGRVSKEPVAPGAELMSYGYFNGSNFLYTPPQSLLEPGSSDYCVSGWFKTNTNATQIFASYRTPGDTDSGDWWQAWVNSNAILFGHKVSGNTSYFTSNTYDFYDGQWKHFVGIREGSSFRVYINGVELSGSVTGTAVGGTINQTDNAQLRLGIHHDGNYGDETLRMAMWKFSKQYVPTEAQIQKIYNDEKRLFQPNAKATIYGTNRSADALGYDKYEDKLYVGNSNGISVFEGLQRVDEYTDYTAQRTISAVKGFMVGE
jgi:hypothetical protein